MPRVPTREGGLTQGPQVTRAPKLNPNMANGAVGDPTNAAIFDSLSKVTGKAADTFMGEYAQAQRQAKQARLLDLDNKAAAVENEIQLHVSGLRGEDALKSGEFAEKRWKQFSDDTAEAISALDNDSASRWSLAYDKRKLSSKKFYEAHALKEGRALHKFQLDTSITQASKAAALNHFDDEKIQQEKNRVAFSAMEKAGLEHGLKPGTDEMDNYVEAHLSQFHDGVIGAKLSAGQTSLAKNYYEENKGEMSVSTREKMLDAITKHSDWDAADSIALDLTEKHASKWEAIKELSTRDDIDDGIKKHARTLLNQNYAAKGKKEDAEKDAIADTIKKLLARGERPDSPKIRNMFWQMGDLKAQNAIIKDWETAQLGIDRVTVQQKFTEFMGLAPQEILSMSDTDKQSKYLQYFSRSDQGKAMGHIAKLSQNLAEGKNIRPYSSWKAIVERRMGAAGITKGKTKFEDTGKHAEFVRVLIDRVEDFQVDKKRPATDTEIRDIVDEAIMDGFEYEAPDWSGDKNFRLGGDFSPNKAESAGALRKIFQTQTTEPMPETAFSEIPTDARGKMAEMASRVGIKRPLSAQEFERLYQVRGDVNQLKSILKEILGGRGPQASRKKQPKKAGIGPSDWRAR